jgi:uncharacterized protein YndB with AHSA1/START domain
MNAPDSTKTALAVTRRYAASPDRVFAAWTDPDSLGRWMSPFGKSVATADVRVGGTFKIIMQGQGTEIEHTGEYLEVDRPRRLVFTWQSPYTGPTPSVVTVELRPDGDQTELILTHERLPEDQVESHRGGWGQILDNLAAALPS